MSNVYKSDALQFGNCGCNTAPKLIIEQKSRAPLVFSWLKLQYFSSITFWRLERLELSLNAFIIDSCTGLRKPCHYVMETCQKCLNQKYVLGVKESLESELKFFNYTLLYIIVTGKLLPDVSMAVRDSYGSILGPGKTGELWFSSSHSSSGYFKKEEETKRSFKNGWIHTGDLGYYDKDGYVYLVGRSKEVFKYLGNHVRTESEGRINSSKYDWFLDWFLRFHLQKLKKFCWIIPL